MGDLPARSRSSRLRAKAGFSGEHEDRERRLAYSILKGGPFVFNSPLMLPQLNPTYIGSWVS